MLHHNFFSNISDSNNSETFNTNSFNPNTNNPKTNHPSSNNPKAFISKSNNSNSLSLSNNLHQCCLCCTNEQCAVHSTLLFFSSAHFSCPFFILSFTTCFHISNFNTSSSCLCISSTKL